MPKAFSAPEAEYELLGLMILDSGVIVQASGYISAEDFSIDKNQLIFNLLKKMIEDNITPEIRYIVKKLKSHKAFQIVSAQDYMAKLISQAGIRSNMDTYIKQIVVAAQKSNVKKMIIDMDQKLNSPNVDVTELITDFQNAVSESGNQTIHEFRDSEDVVNQAIRELELRRSGELGTGLMSELNSLDRLTSGFQKGDLVILAARPSMGKTAFAINIGKNIAKENKVALFSLEMPAVQIMNRVLSSESNVSGNNIKNARYLSQNDMRKIHSAKENIKKLDFFIDDTPGLKLAELIWKAKQLHKNKGLDVLIIDYLQLITTNSKSTDRQFEVSMISNALKKLARELEIPVIALSQLSRRVEQREDKRPLMSDLRESGAIEQDADLIMLLYRKSYYEKKEESEKDNHLSDASINIAKHRNGATGEVELVFMADVGTFLERPNN